VGQTWLCTANTASHVATLLLVPALDIQGQNLSSYEMSYPFVIFYLEQDFSGILLIEANVLMHYT
jgi:hypothetical protein